MKQGDIYSFSTLYLYYDNKSDFTSIFPYAILMANKYNHNDAYWIIFENFIKINNNGIYKPEYYYQLNKENQDFIMYYLIKGINANDSHCKKIKKEVDAFK